jgi:hypothetical protein
MFGGRPPSPMNLSKLEAVRVKLNLDRLTTGHARSVVISQSGKGLRQMGDHNGESSVACDDHLFRKYHLDYLSSAATRSRSVTAPIR